MESLMRELIISIDKLSSFSWNDMIALGALIGSWVTIFFLLIERCEKNRPYLQINFELIRSNLACVVLRNTGNVPLILKKLEFDKEFIKQLPNEEKKGLEKLKIKNIRIFPGKQWIVCLGVIIPEILENYKKKNLEITYSYSKINRKKQYNENIEIDFEQYSRFLVYVSEIDELREVNKKIEKNIENTNKELKKIYASIVQYQNINQTNIKTIINGYKKESE